jgi:hypothetical protein
MPKIRYVRMNLKQPTLDLIAQANEIIAEYDAAGLKLTLRQLYYQFVSRDLIPNTMKSYKRLGSIINDGRMAGLIDWDAIEDRTRGLEANPHWSTPADILHSAADSFALDKWRDQPSYVEVWIEKDALTGILMDVCGEEDVPYFSCRGYTSQSEMFAAGMRLKSHAKAGRNPVIIHLGDHDPSGIDMTRDVADRLTLFCGSPVEVNRIALNWEQVQEYQPPPNPAKMTDSRFAGYEANYGSESWELDAIEPLAMQNLIRDAIRTYRDDDAWDAAVEREQEGKNTLRQYYRQERDK